MSSLSVILSMDYTSLCLKTTEQRLVVSIHTYGSSAMFTPYLSVKLASLCNLHEILLGIFLENLCKNPERLLRTLLSHTPPHWNIRFLGPQWNTISGLWLSFSTKYVWIRCGWMQKAIVLMAKDAEHIDQSYLWIIGTYLNVAFQNLPDLKWLALVTGYCNRVCIRRLCSLVGCVTFVQVLMI